MSVKPTVNPAQIEHARQRRRRMDLWRHRVRQVAVAEMSLKRLESAGADVSAIAAAAEALAKAQHAAGMRADAA